MPTITPNAVPTGGIVTLTISGAVSGTATLTRTASGSTPVTLYSGSPPLNLYIDVGDGLNFPLSQTTYYQYQYTDNSGTASTGFILPASNISLQQEPLTAILLRFLQGAIQGFALPQGVRTAEVTHAMPLGGAIPFPLIVVNLDLFQQSAVPIGQSVAPLSTAITNTNGGSGYTLTGFARRMYRVSILTNNATERDFYRDNLVGALITAYGSIFQPLGLDVSHKWQCSSGQVANDKEGKAPGFYFAEIMFEFEGTLNVVINPTYGLIQTLTMTVSGEAYAGQTLQSVDVIEVPLV